jgi:hypothetical protein
MKNKLKKEGRHLMNAAPTGPSKTRPPARRPADQIFLDVKYLYVKMTLNEHLPPQQYDN